MNTEELPGDGWNESIAIVRALEPTGLSGVSLADPDLKLHAKKVLGTKPAAWATEIARATCGLIVEEGFEGEDAPVKEIGAAAETALLVLLLRLTGHSASPLAGTARQSEIIRYRIAHGTPFHRVVRSQRLAQHRWADLLLAEAARQNAGSHTIRMIVTTLDRYFDEGIDWHLGFYLAEQERFAHSEATERARLVEALVAGRDVDPTLAQDRLGVNLAGTHLALVLEDAVEHPADAEGRITEVLSALSRAAATSAISHRPSAGVAWLWLAGRAAAKLDSVQTLLQDKGVRAGIGGAYSGEYGFRRSHVEAGESLRFARHRQVPMIYHRDVALVGLLSADLERARWFVRAQLGGLARSDPKSAELRDTLTEYYLAGTRLSTAAAALHVHRNTLLYRLRHIAEMLGHAVTEMTPDLQCALLLAAEFGAAVLDRPGPRSASVQLTPLTALHSDSVAVAPQNR